MLTLKYPSNLASEYQGVPFVDIRSQLPVNPHYTWSQLAGIRPIETLNTIVCHHDGMSKKSTAKYPDIVLAKRIAKAHIDSKKHHPKGDPGFPYDLWIRNGILYWCNDIEPREYGVANNNGYTVNICVSGNYANIDSMTDADRKALYVAIMMMKETLPNDKFIKAHKELSSTACPGYDINQVRSDILAMEEELSFQVDTTALAADAYKLAVRVKDLLSKLKHAVWGKEAARKLGLLKGVVEGASDGIANTILTLYKSASDEKFIGESADKLATIINEAKRLKLI